MVSLVVLLPVGLLVAYLIGYYRSLARNLAAAKRSGIPYIVLPVYTFNRAWLITHRLWLPLLEKIPGSEKWTKYVYHSGISSSQASYKSL
jgi:hypothetical protein